MIERHVTFEVLPEKATDFEALFVQAYRPAMASMPGYVNVELLRAQAAQTEYQMVIRFESTETAAAWRASDAHQAISPRIKALYSASHVAVYDVVA
jgi:antibiotic biosynthesis monooxygenase (ABM) superfamily enzyme